MFAGQIALTLFLPFKEKNLIHRIPWWCIVHTTYLVHYHIDLVKEPRPRSSLKDSNEKATYVFMKVRVDYKLLIYRVSKIPT